MSEINIDDLPEEMLIKVFRLLDTGNLKNATLTCKLWKNLIESACRWSLSLVPNYYEKYKRVSEQKVNFIMATNRKFEAISGYSVWGYENHIFEIFEKHGRHVVKLCLSDGNIDSLDAFVQLLQLCPNLKYVDLTMVALNDVNDVPDRILPKLTKLTNLEMSGVDYRFSQCFRKAKLTTIKIYVDDDSEHRITLAPFILSQDMLTSLTAESYSESPSILAEMGKLDVPNSFRLTKLAILDGADRNSTHDYNLLKFVKSQTNSLTEMEIGHGITSSVYECVFASMTKLNSLTVSPNFIPQNNEFYERLQENVNVRTMKILDIDPTDESSCDMQYFGTFLKRLPNIRNLFVSPYGCRYENILAVASQNLSKLEFLYVDSIDERSIDDIGRANFFNLSTLHIGTLHVKIDWNELTKIHSRLVELTIEEMKMKSFFTSDIDEITTNVDLQNLKLGVGFVADDRFFEIIRMKCPNLKVLDLHKSCVTHEINCYKENNLLRLCDVLECSKYTQMLVHTY